MEMTPFLFEYHSQWSTVRYMMVYEEDYKIAYAKIDAYLNPTQQIYTITLATILPDMEAEPKK